MFLQKPITKSKECDHCEVSQQLDEVFKLSVGTKNTRSLHLCLACLENLAIEINTSISKSINAEFLGRL